jgi:hypothetical protein
MINISCYEPQQFEHICRRKKTNFLSQIGGNMFTFLHLILMCRVYILSTDGDALRADPMAVEKGV